MEGINETVLTGYPSPIPYDCSKEIIKQMEKNICKLKIGNDQGTGFFCKIPFPDKEHQLTVLITNNHVIDENLLFKENAVIPLDIKDRNELKYLNLNNRMKSTYHEDIYDTTIIEIKKEDEINDYLELDDNIINNIKNDEINIKEYIDKTMYIIQYPEGESSVSYGIFLTTFEDKKYNIVHKCCTKEGSSGSPILNINKNKVIGIHKKGDKKYNIGTLLNYPIKEFIKEHYYKKEKNIDNLIEDILIKEINDKYSLNIKDINHDANLIKKYLGNEGFIDLNKFRLYYKNKIENSFLGLDFHQKVIKQMEKCICGASYDYNCHDTMFFCKIPFPNKNKMLPVLITNNHSINEKDNKIFLSINRGNQHIELNIDKNRIFYTNEEFDTTIIEIKAKDQIKCDYFELDDIIINNILNNENNNNIDLYYMDEPIYLIYCCGGDTGQCKISYGRILELAESVRGCQFIFRCKLNCTDSPILNLNNNKLIGITESYMFKKHCYRGTYLIYPIKDFIQKYYHMNQNKKNNFNIKDNLSKEEIIIEKYNSVKSLLTKKVFENLNKLVSYNNINIKAAPSRSPLCLETEEALVQFSLKNIENIVEQIKGYYKIKIGSEIINGFICKIPILNKNKYLKVLITSNSNINEEILNKKDGKISIEINGEKIKYISLNNIMKYTSKAYDTTILEIKEEAEINNYLEIDDNIFNGDINHSPIKLEDSTIYSIIYQYGKLSTLYGMIQKQENNLFYHSIGVGSPGSPIFNKKNKLIGMHIGMHSNRNIGQCLYYPIKEFIEKNFLE